jgi:rubredoxin
MERRIAASDADRNGRAEKLARPRLTHAVKGPPRGSPLRSRWPRRCASCPRHLWWIAPARPRARQGQGAKRVWSRVPNWWRCSACERQQRSRMTRMMPTRPRKLRLEPTRREHGRAMRGSTMGTLAPRSCRCRPSGWWCLPLWSPCRLPSGGASTEANLELSGACACAAPLASRIESSRQPFSAVQVCAGCRRTTGDSDRTPRAARTIRAPRPIVSAIKHCEMNQRSARASRDWLK